MRIRNEVKGFVPSTCGFQFSNRFPSVPLFKLPGTDIAIGDASNGLCGGMVYAARDFFEAGQQIPDTRVAPAGGVLFDFLVRRLFDSFDLELPPPLPPLPGRFPMPLPPYGPGPATYLFLMNPALPDHETTASKLGLTPHGRGWVVVNQAWPAVKAAIDAQRPCPLGLVLVKSANPALLGENHQVLCYGYDLDDDQNLTLRVYDPNRPGRDSESISFSIASPDGTIQISSTRGPIFSIFAPSYARADIPRVLSPKTTDIVFYDSTAGQCEFYKTDGRGGLSKLGSTQTNLRRTWTAIVPGEFNSSTTGTDLLFYDASSGQGEFYSTDGSGGLSQIGSSHLNWRKSWTKIAAGRFSAGGTSTDLFFYDSVAGEGEFYGTDGHGGLIRRGATAAKLPKLLTQVVAGKFGGPGLQDDILCYDAESGDLTMFSTGADGRLSRFGGYRKWRQSWTAIIPGDFGGTGSGMDLLFYNAVSGQAEFYAADGKDGLNSIGKPHLDWRKLWSLIVPGSFGGTGSGTDMLFYDSSAGRGEFFGTDLLGDIVKIGPTHTDWRTSWRAIVVGDFSQVREKRVKVPAVIGLPYLAAGKLISDAGLTARWIGSVGKAGARVRNQSPPPGGHQVAGGPVSCTLSVRPAQ